MVSPREVGELELPDVRSMSMEESLALSGLATEEAVSESEVQRLNTDKRLNVSFLPSIPAP